MLKYFSTENILIYNGSTSLLQEKLVISEI